MIQQYSRLPKHIICLIGTLLLSNVQTNLSGATSLTDVHPKVAPLQGGTVVHITGTGITFTSTCQLNINKIAVLSVPDSIVHNDTYMTCTMPPITNSQHVNLIGNNDNKITLRVTNSLETFDISLFDLDSIIITGIVPNGGYTTSQTLIAIIGSGFTNTSLITGNFQSYSTSCQFVNSTCLTCILPTYPVSDQVIINIYLNGQPSSQIRTSFDDTTLFTYFITPPLVESIKFTQSYSSLLMTLDRESEIGQENEYNTTTEPQCQFVFDDISLSKLGAGTTCSWLNTQQRQIVVYLSSNTTLLPNVTVALNSTSIRTRYVSYSKHASGNFVIQPNQLFLYPIAILESPMFIPYCGDLSLFAGNSQYGGPLPLAFHWSITVVAIDDVDISGFDESGEGLETENILNFLPKGFTQKSFLSLPTELFTTGNVYVVELTVKNFIGLTDSTTVTLRKHAYPAPDVRIKGGPLKMLSATELILIESTASLPNDCLEDDSGSLQYNWIVSNSLSMTGLRLDSPILQIPAHTLAENTQYTFTVYVTYNNLATSNASVSVSTLSHSLQSTIQGGKELTYGIDDNIILDLSQSSRFTDISYTILWNCSMYSDNKTVVIVEPLIQTYIPAHILKPGTYTVTGAIEYSNTVSTAIQTIHILDDTNGPFAFMKWPSQFESVLVHKKFVINGIVSSQLEGLVEWSCLSVKGYAYIQLDQLTLAPSNASIVTDTSILTEYNKVFVVNSQLPSNPISLVIPPGSLLHNNAYRFRLSVNDERYADIDIQTASKPLSGIVEVTPGEGVALVTKFTLQALHWTDDIGTLPLYYRFGFLSNDDIFWLTGISETSSHSTLLPLPLHEDMTVDIVTEIYNSKGSLTVHYQSITISSPTNVVDLADFYNNIRSDSLDMKKWNEGLSDLIAMLYSIDITERYANISLNVLSETYITTFKQSSIELVVQLFSSQLPSTRNSLIRVLEALSFSVSNTQLSNDLLTSLLSTVESIVKFLTDNNIVSPFSDKGLSEVEAQIILSIYEKLMSTATEFDYDRVMNNEISKSFFRISQTIGIGLCQQLEIYEESILINNYFGTLKVYFSILPHVFNVTCPSSKDDCPFHQQTPSNITFGSDSFQTYIKSSCTTNADLGNFTDCKGICIITTQLRTDFHWSGNPYTNHIKTLPVIATVARKNKTELLLDSIKLRLFLTIESSQNGTLRCVAWNDDRWSINNCQTNILTSQVVDCTCRTSQEVAVIDYCPSGFYGKACTEVCPQGLWGNECRSVCNCNQRGTCSAVDGSCDCIPGWTGDSCQTKCNTNFWGKDCLKVCLCEQSDYCHHVDGSCECSDGWIGTYCNESCPIGYYGKDCSSNCTCRNDTECHNVNGTCACQSGYMGETCHDECPNGYYSNNCETPCGCNVNGTYSCDHVYGTCNCSEEWNGTLCERLISIPVEPDPPVVIWWVVFPVLIAVSVVVILVAILVTVRLKKSRAVVPISDDKESGSKESIDGEEDELEMTRAKSLVLLRGVKTESNSSVGQFKEPERFGSKIRWQIIQLIPVERKATVNESYHDDNGSLHSELNVQEESDEFEEVIFLKGVYLEPGATLKDLRNNFIDSDQLEPTHLYFQFLKSDTPGDIVRIDNEEEMSLLNFKANQQTIYIQSIDKNGVGLELCVCGKFAELECTQCKSKGYCSETCQQNDWIKHIGTCRIVSARRREDRRMKRKKKKLEKLKKTGYTPRPDLCRCGKMTEYECSECGLQGYCSVECQEDDWEYHKLFCKT